MFLTLYSYLVICFFVRSQGSLSKVFVISSSDCFENCNGTLSQPFNNLWAAMQEFSNTSCEIILIVNQTQPSYLQSKIISNDGHEYLYPKMININENITIRPLFCSDLEAKTANQSCLEPDGHIIIHLKDETLRIAVMANLTILNIVFTGIENIAELNKQNPEIDLCINRQYDCCREEEIYSFVFPSIKCRPISKEIINLNTSSSLFTLYSTKSDNSLEIRNCKFLKLYFFKTSSLIKLGNISKIIIENSIFDNFYFFGGLISQMENLEFNSSVIIQNSSFSKYNGYEFQPSNISNIGLICHFMMPMKVLINQTKILDSVFYNPIFNFAYLLDSIISELSFKNITIHGNSDVSALLIIFDSHILLSQILFSEVTIIDAIGINIIGLSHANLINLLIKDSYFESLSFNSSALKIGYNVDGIIQSFLAQNCILQSANNFVFLIESKSEKKLSFIEVEISRSDFFGKSVGLLISKKDTMLFNFKAIYNNFHGNQALFIWIFNRFELTNSYFIGNNISSSGFFTVNEAETLIVTRSMIRENVFIGDSSISETVIIKTFGISEIFQGLYIDFTLNTLIDCNLLEFHEYSVSNISFSSFLLNNFQGVDTKCSIISTGINSLLNMNGNAFSSNSFVDNTQLIIIEPTGLLSMVNCIFSKNKASTLSGYLPLSLIYIDVGVNFTAVNLTFSENTFLSLSSICYGINFYDQNNFIDLNNFNITGNNFQGISVFIWPYESTVIIKKLIFINNTADSDTFKSYIFVFSSVIATIEDILISDNYIINDNFFIYSDSSIFYFLNGKIHNNIIGGFQNSNYFMVFTLGFTNLNNVVISNNIFLNRACFIFFSANQIKIENTLINLNHLESFDQVLIFFIYFPGGGDIIRNTTFQENLMIGDQGLVTLFSIYSEPIMHYIQVNFINNIGYGNSEFTYCSVSSILITMYDSIIRGNYINASYIIYSSGSTFVFKNIVLINNIFNTSFGKANGIYQDCIFSHNKFLDHSFFVSDHLDSYTFINCLFIENQLALSSKLISINQGFFEITNSSFQNNTLLDKSTLIYLELRAKLKLNDVVYQSNYFTAFCYIIQAVDYSSVNGNSLTFNDNQFSAKESKTSFHLFYIYNSEFNFKDVQIDSSIGLMQTFISVGNITNLSITSLIPVNGERSLMNLFDTSLAIHGLQIESDISQIQQDKWITATTSSVELFDSRFSSIRASVGYIGSFINSTFTFKKGMISDINFESGYIFNFFNSEQVIIADMLINNSSSLLSSSSGILLKLENLTYFSDKMRYFIISIEYFERIIISDVILISSAFDIIELTSVLSLKMITTSILISNCKFKNMQTIYGALYFSLPQITKNVTVIDSLFLNNSATGLFGGALTVEKSSSTTYLVQNCIFKGNKALKSSSLGGKGGAIYLSSDQENEPSLIIISNSSFENNYADLTGGAIYIYGTPPRLISNTFLNNFIQDTINHVASQAVKIELTSKLSNQRILNNASFDPNWNFSQSSSLINIGSGIPLGYAFNVVLKDLYDQIVIDDSYSTLSFLQTENSNVQISVISVKSDKGIYRIDNLILTSIPGSNVKLQIQSNGIPKFRGLQFPSDQDTSKISLDLSFRNCFYGEILQKDGSCQPCTEGFATFDISVNSKSLCKKCDLVAMACNGGALVGPKKGHWRMTNFSDQFLECPVPEACLGYEDNNTSPGIGKCLHPYRGNLCGSCDPEYTLNDGKCEKCLEYKAQIIWMIVGIIVNLIIVKTTIDSTEKKGKKYLENSEEDSGPILKNLITFLQLSSFIGQIKIELPGNIFVLSTVGDNLAISKANLFSIRCLYPKDQLNATYIDLILTTTTPFILFVMISFLMILWFLIKKRNIFKSSEFKHKILVTFIVLCYNFQAPILLSNLQIFQCVNLHREDSSSYFLKSNYDIECWSGEHLKWLVYFASPMVFIWGISIPLFLFVILTKNRRRLNEKEVVLKYSFIYKGYKNDKYYWEFVIMIRKYLLIVINIFGAYRSSGFQIFTALYVIIISYKIEIKNHPFVMKYLNDVQNASLKSLTQLCLLALFYYSIDSVTVLKGIVIAIWGVYTLDYLRKWLISFFHGYLKNLVKKALENKKIKAAITKVQNKFPKLCPRKKVRTIELVSNNDPTVENKISLTPQISIQEMKFTFDDNTSSNKSKQKSETLIDLEKIINIEESIDLYSLDQSSESQRDNSPEKSVIGSSSKLIKLDLKNY